MREYDLPNDNYDNYEVDGSGMNEAMLRPKELPTGIPRVDSDHGYDRVTVPPRTADELNQKYQEPSPSIQAAIIRLVVAPWCGGAILSAEEPPVRLQIAIVRSRSKDRMGLKDLTVRAFDKMVAEKMASEHPRRQTIEQDVYRYRYTARDEDLKPGCYLAPFLDGDLGELTVYLNLNEALPVDVCQRVRVETFRVECHVFHAQGRNLEGLSPSSSASARLRLGL